MNLKRYCLTGAGGFLGRICKSVLEDRQFSVTGLGRRNQEIHADIGQKFTLAENSNFEVFVHAAGKAHSVPKTPEEEQAFFQVNFEGTKNLCAAIDQLSKKPKAFIFISTVSVYGVDAGEQIREDDPPKGSSPYAKSKILAEAWLTEWAKNKGIILGILRLPLVAGPQPPGNLGAMVSGIRRGRYLSIGNASARKSMVWAADVAAIIPRLTEVGGVFNLTDGYHPSFGELEKAISGTMGKKPPARIPLSL